MKKSKELKEINKTIMPKNKRSFFERLTGSYNDEPEEEGITYEGRASGERIARTDDAMVVEDDDEEGELAMDVYQTPDDIIVQAIVAGVKPEDVDVAITRDTITVKGRRQDARKIESEDFYYQELYWGYFGRTISLPQEIDVDSAEASIKNGVLTVKLPRLDKDRTQKLKVKEE